MTLTIAQINAIDVLKAKQRQENEMEDAPNIDVKPGHGGRLVYDKERRTIVAVQPATSKADVAPQIHGDVIEALTQALEYFENQSDVVDGSYGEPAPNREMSLAQLCRDALAHAEAWRDADLRDARWAVNVLLEKIAANLEGWQTWDIWRSDAAMVVRGFKHDLSKPSRDDLTYDDMCRLSRLFNETARIDTPQDYFINEWLKTQIEARKPRS